MFIMLLKYIKPLEDVDAVLEPHRAFLQKYFAQGEFICAGRQVPRTGGVILCRAASPAEARAIAAEDPFTVAGVAEYEVVEFQPTVCAQGFENLD